MLQLWRNHQIAMAIQGYGFRVDYCVDNYFRVVETISKLCGEDDEDYALQQTKIQCLFASPTFLR